MTRFVVGDDRSQSTLFPERLDDYLGEDNPVRAIDVLVDELDLAKLGFDGVEPEATGRPAYHPATLLKIYVYGYLNRVQMTALGQTGPDGPEIRLPSARVFQTSTCSAIARASSTSMPRYRTVLSILVCPSRSWTALRLPVRR